MERSGTGLYDGWIPESGEGCPMSGKAEGTQASVFPGLSDGKAAERIGVLCAEDMKTSGILASVSAAQFILESGYGRTELAQKANNCFGMKCVLSGNSWGGSA